MSLLILALLASAPSGEEGASGPAARVLMAERNCAACHGDLEPAGRIEGPDLSLASHRLRREWLEAFLAAPLEVHPDGRMPDPWAGQDAAARAEAAAALADLLEARRGAFEAPGPTGDPRAGERLFHTVGCFACHGPRAESELGDAVPEVEGLVSLDAVPAKYTGAGLADFLLQPLEHRPGGLMPDLHLSREEAADVAAYLLEGSDAPWASALADQRPSPTKGLLLWESAGCASCHALDGPAVPRDVGPAAANASGGCLADPPSGPTGFAGGAPDFGLDDARRATRGPGSGRPSPRWTAGSRPRSPTWATRRACRRP